MVDSQFGVLITFLDPVQGSEFASDRVYSSDAQLWRDFIAETVSPQSVVHIQRTQLTEWFPWSPGVFHTPEASGARDLAMDFVVKVTPRTKREM